jgi:inner membrane protein
MKTSARYGNKNAGQNLNKPMASIFGHAMAGLALSKLHFNKTEQIKITALAVLCTCLPDADVISFTFGIPYEHPLGHRGFTHSLVFSLVFGVSLAWLLYRKRQGWLLIASLFVLSMASHGLLDMMTNGGRGVALYWPFSNERLFFGFRPLEVSPIGASYFFSEWGLRVLKSEAMWIGVPALGVYLFARQWGRNSGK